MLDEKSLQIFIGDMLVAVIDDLDGAVGKPRSAHIVILDQAECVLFTDVQQEGKTKVSRGVSDESYSTSMLNSSCAFV